MYEAPSRDDIKRVVIDAKTIRERKRRTPSERWSAAADDVRDMEKTA